MNFYFDEQPINQSRLILNNDYSFKTVDNAYWDFQVSIEPYDVLLLNFNYELKECVGIEGFLNISKCKSKKIILECKKKGTLKIDNFNVSKDAYGVAYKLSFKQCYFDDKAKIFAIGNIDNNVETLNIGIGRYVKIKDGKIVALFLQF